MGVVARGAKNRNLICRAARARAEYGSRQRDLRGSNLRFLLAAFALLSALAPARAQQAPADADGYFRGKTLTILVGLESGGTVDLYARSFSQVLRKYLAGNPTILVQNMPGGGGLVATNYLHERARPDGLTILYGPWDPLAQALQAPGLHARYENFAYLGGTGDVRVLYGRTDLIAGGLQKPADLARAKNVIVGALNATDVSGLLPHLALEVLGVSNRSVVGYRGGNDVFLALQRGEVQFSSTSITTFCGRNSALIKSGDGRGLAYLTPVDAAGRFERVAEITEMPAFPDLHREIHGEAPRGAKWDAMNWLTNQIGELTFLGLAPGGAPPQAVAALRRAYEAAARDPEFVQQSIAASGMAYTFVSPARGAAIFRSLAEVTPEVLATLRQITGAGRP